MTDIPINIGDLEISIPSFTPSPRFKEEAYESATTDISAFSNWFGAVQASGVRYPATMTIPLSINLQSSMLGERFDVDPTEEIDKLVEQIQQFGSKYGFPLFLKTSFTSNKHWWDESCCLKDASRDTVMRHIHDLHEFQAMFSPHLFSPELVVREMIEVDPKFHAFQGMPVTEEYRLFARDGKLEAYQPYWPKESIKNPSVENWAALLETIKTPSKDDLAYMSRYAEKISKKLGGYWSVDFLRAKDGTLWLIDMADGDLSYVNQVDLVKIEPEQDLEP